MTRSIRDKAVVESRFSDLGPYGHVNFKHYFDFVVGSRNSSFESRFSLSLTKIARNGIGFYTIRG